MKYSRVVIFAIIGLAAAKDSFEATPINLTSGLRHSNEKLLRFLEEEEEEEDPCQDVGEGKTEEGKSVEECIQDRREADMTNTT